MNTVEISCCWETWCLTVSHCPWLQVEDVNYWTACVLVSSHSVRAYPQGTPFIMKTGLQSAIHIMNGTPWKNSTVQQCCYYCFKQMYDASFFLSFFCCVLFLLQSQRAEERQKGMAVMNPVGLKLWFCSKGCFAPYSHQGTFDNVCSYFSMSQLSGYFWYLVGGGQKCC